MALIIVDLKSLSNLYQSRSFCFLNQIQRSKKFCESKVKILKFVNTYILKIMKQWYNNPQN